MIGEFLKNRQEKKGLGKWGTHGGSWREYTEHLFGFRLYGCYLRVSIRFRLWGFNSETKEYIVGYARRASGSGTNEIIGYRCGYLHASIAIHFSKLKKLRFIIPKKRQLSIYEFRKQS